MALLKKCVSGQGLHSGRLCLGLTQIVSEIAKKIDPNLSLAFLIKGVLIKEKALSRLRIFTLPTHTHKICLSEEDCHTYGSSTDLTESDDKGKSSYIEPIIDISL